MKSVVKSLGSDNHSGVHPKILAALAQCNSGHSPAYGTDDRTLDVEKLFKQIFGPQSESFFVFNGTAANVLSIKTLLQSHHAVICSEDSHLHMDECGAPEAIAGVKLRPLPTADGKLTPAICEKAMIRGGDQHYSQAKMLTITQPTEVGTLYSYAEMKALGEFCRQHKLYFHVDGARFIHASTQLKKSFKELTVDVGVDVLSFGGTKNGLLFGEAVVFMNALHAKEFKFIRKQAMQLPSKMRFLAAQFEALLQNDLWREISEHECRLAKYLEAKIKKIPQLEITQKVQANSLFVKLPQKWIKPLKKEKFFYIWDEDKFIARWMMSFDSSEKDLDEFFARIQKLSAESR